MLLAVVAALHEGAPAPELVPVEVLRLLEPRSEILVAKRGMLDLLIGHANMLATHRMRAGAQINP